MRSIPSRRCAWTHGQLGSRPEKRDHERAEQPRRCTRSDAQRTERAPRSYHKPRWGRGAGSVNALRAMSYPERRATPRSLTR